MLVLAYLCIRFFFDMNKITPVLLLLFIVGISLKLSANTPTASRPTPGITWISWETAVKLSKKKKKKVLVDVYTGWCYWCKVMDQKTFPDETLAKYISEHFYAVKLDAEQKTPILFNKKKFKYIAQGSKGIHELAYSLLDGKLGFPALVYMNESFQRINVSPGYKTPDVLLKELEAVVREDYKKK